MAFNPNNWSTVSSSGMRPVRTSGGSLTGAPALFNYISNVDTQAVIAGANYFAKQAYILSVGDQIYAVDSVNNPRTYMVSVVAIGPTGNTVTLVNAAPAAGDVVGPVGATDNALVRFDGVTGTLIQNGVILESDVGDLTLVNSIANGAGLLATPSYTFTGDLDTGMWHSAANTVDFSTNAFRSLQLAPSPALSVNYSVITASATGNPVIWAPAGTDANISIRLQPKGTGQVVNNVGAVGTPSYSFAGDLTTGMWSSGVGVIDFSSEGLTAAAITSGIAEFYGINPGTAASIRLFNQDATNYVSFEPPFALANTQNYTTPVDFPTVDFQVLASTTAGIMSWANPNQGIWVAVPGNVGLAVNTGYVTTNGALATLTLPATANLGDVIEVVGEGAGMWSIIQAAGQGIVNNGSATTVGAAGHLDATHRYNCVKMVCIVAGANTIWNVASGSGNPNYL
jgi:hypothetical protein